MSEGKKPVIDLSDFDTTKACDAGAEIELHHPTKSEVKLGQFIKIAGKDSKAFRDIVATNANRERRREFEARRKGRTPDIISFEKTQEESTELLVACTLGFRNIFYNGAPLPFTPDNARNLYTEMFWVREQVDSAIVDLENFIKS